MSDELRSRVIDVLGNKIKLKLTPATFGIAHMRGVSVAIDDEMKSNDFVLAMHLLWIAAQRDFPKKLLGKEDFINAIAERDDQQELCAWIIGEYMDATEALKKSYAPRHLKRIEAQQKQTIQEVLERYGLNRTESTPPSPSTSD